MRSLFIYNLRIWSTCARARGGCRAVLQKRADCSSRGQQRAGAAPPPPRHHLCVWRPAPAERVRACWRRNTDTDGDDTSDDGGSEDGGGVGSDDGGSEDGGTEDTGGTEDAGDVAGDDAGDDGGAQDTGGTEDAGDDSGVTVAQFAHMLDSRQPELTYTDTGAGWKLLNEVKPLPIDQVMTVMRDAYGCDAELTCDMIFAIDWLNAGADDFRASATDDDNIVAQLCAVLSGAEMPTLTRQYPHLDMTCSPPAQRGAEYFVAPRAHSDSDEDADAEEAGDALGPAMQALVAAFAAAYEQDRKHHRTD
jgi:hypothetical protein